MKYFTKEWYSDLMLSDICFQFRKTERAGEYSDSFFERLYAVEQKAYIKYAKRSARAARLPFDKSAASAEFDGNYKANLEFVKAKLPEDILSDIKDIRVLALGSVTDEMAQRITRLCGKKNRLCEAVERRYNDASEEMDERIGGSTSRALLSLIGSRISSFTIDGENAKIEALCEEGNTISLTLTGAVNTENDDAFVGSSVLKYELLPADDDKIEFSALSMGDDTSLHTVSFTAKEIKTTRG